KKNLKKFRFYPLNMLANLPKNPFLGSSICCFAVSLLLSSSSEAADTFSTAFSSSPLRSIVPVFCSAGVSAVSVSSVSSSSVSASADSSPAFGDSSSAGASATISSSVVSGVTVSSMPASSHVSSALVSSACTVSSASSSVCGDSSLSYASSAKNVSTFSTGLYSRALRSYSSNLCTSVLIFDLSSLFSFWISSSFSSTKASNLDTSLSDIFDT